MRDIPDTDRDLLDNEVASLSTIGDDGFPTCGRGISRAGRASW